MDNGKEIRYFSMFTGVGGFERGFEGAENKDSSQIQVKQDASLQLNAKHNRSIGNSPCTYEYGKGRKNDSRFKCIGFSEKDKYASQVLRYQFPTIKNYGDATKINAEELPDFDILCGGFPCQAFSIAGKRAGFNDTRGTLFFEIARILEVKRPKLVFLENVKGLLNHDQGKTFKVIIQTLEELGYDVQWMVLNSKFFGVPQNRERIFIIGNIRGTSRPEILPFSCNNSEALTSRQSQNVGTICAQYARNPTDGNYIREKLIDGAQGFRVYDTNGESQTLQGQSGGMGAKTGLYAIASHSPRSGNPKKGGTGPLISKEHCFTIDSSPHNLIDGIKIRRLTVTECERLQSFPDGWTEYGIDEKGNKVKISDTQRYKMMGNAVTTKVVSAIAKSFLA